MLGQKEICGLIFVLGCSVVHSAPAKPDLCLKYLQINAIELENAVKNFVSISSNLEYNHTKFPNLNASQEEIRPIIEAFHTLFDQLNKTIDGAGEIKSLQQNLQQQAACLRSWNYTKSSINIPNNEKDEPGKKILLIKASEHYSKLMQKFLNEMVAEVVKGSA